MPIPLPNGDRAVLDIRKIEDYCLNLDDQVGCREARVSPVCDLLGAVMAAEMREGGDSAAPLGAVALLSDLPERGLLRGQVGVIVETLDDATALVEFSDDRGRAYAITPCPKDVLLVLRRMPRAA